MTCRFGAPLFAAALLAGCGGAPRAALPADHVDMPRSYMFTPANLSVRAGTRVTFVNHDVFTHGVQLAGSDSVKVVAPGDSTTVQFDRVGEQAYVCPFHPQMMKGTVRVEGS